MKKGFLSIINNVITVIVLLFYSTILLAQNKGPVLPANPPARTPPVTQQGDVSTEIGGHPAYWPWVVGIILLTLLIIGVYKKRSRRNSVSSDETVTL